MYRADDTMAMKEERIKERIHLCSVIKIVDVVESVTEKRKKADC